MTFRQSTVKYHSDTFPEWDGFEVALAELIHKHSMQTYFSYPEDLMARHMIRSAIALVEAIKDRSGVNSVEHMAALQEKK
jgi:hypothetical protein